MRDYDELLRERLASFSKAEKAEYQAYADEAELILHLSELIYQARNEAKMTQAQLANIVGTDQPYISALENGTKDVTIKMLSKVAAATGKKVQVTLV